MCRQFWRLQQQQWLKMVPNFLSVTWYGKAFHRIEVQDVKSLVQLGLLFPLDGEGRKEGKKKRNEERKKSLWGRTISLVLDLPS
jgi:hypothetical protein